MLREGRESIPLKLEELGDLTLIDMRIKAWRERANKAIKAGPMAQSLWLNFQKINIFGNQKALTTKIGLTQSMHRLDLWSNEVTKDEIFPKCFVLTKTENSISGFLNQYEEFKTYYG